MLAKTVTFEILYCYRFTLYTIVYSMGEQKSISHLFPTDESAFTQVFTDVNVLEISWK